MSDMTLASSLHDATHWKKTPFDALKDTLRLFSIYFSCNRYPIVQSEHSPSFQKNMKKKHKKCFQLSVCLLFCLFSVCLPDSLLNCLSFCLLICLFVCLFWILFASFAMLSVYLSSVFVPVCSSFCPPICLSVCLPVLMDFCAAWSCFTY